MLTKGNRVKVISCSDECGSPELIGEEGVIYGINSNGLTGNTRRDPLYQVRLSGGKEESFWEEELTLINK